MTKHYIPSLLRLNSIIPTKQVLSLFSYELSKEFSAVPLRLENNTLLIASAEPVGFLTHKKLENTLRRPIRSYQCTWLEFRIYQARCYDIVYPLGQLTPDMENHLREKLFPASTSEHIIDQDHPIIDVHKNGELEFLGLLHNLPHLRPGSVLPRKGLDILLPESWPREHFCPLTWVDGTLFCLVDDPKWIEISVPKIEELEFICQFVIADSEIVVRTYQRFVLRGKSRISSSNKEIVEWLIQTGLLKEEQGIYALQAERQAGSSAREVLIESGLIDAGKWLIAAAELIDVLAITEEDIPNEFERILLQTKDLIPAWIVRKFHILPIVKENGILILGFSVFDHRLIDLAAALTHLEIEPRLMDILEIDHWIDKVYFPADQHPMIHPIQMDALLKEFGYLTSSQYEDANLASISDKRSLFEIAAERGYLHEHDLVDLYGYQTGYPTSSLDTFSFDENLIRQFPLALLHENYILPLCETKDVLWIACADPYLTEVFQQIEYLTSKTVCPVIAPRSILIQLIERYCQPARQGAQDSIVHKLMDQFVLNGLMTQKQAFAAMQENDQTDSSLDLAITNQSGLSPLAFAKNLSGFLAVPFADISLQEETISVIDALGVSRQRTRITDPVVYQAARLISLEIAQQFKALPVRFQGDHIVVAFTDPLFASSQKILESMLNKSILPMITSRQMLEDAINRTLERPKLGTVLLMAGMISRAQLNDALDYARRANIRLGRALVFKHYISEEALYQFLSKQSGIPLFDLSTAVIDEKTAHLLDARVERTHGILPLSEEKSHIVLATIDPQIQEVLARGKPKLNKAYHLVLVTENDFDRTLENLYRDEYLNESVSALLERTPEDSAFRVLVPNQVAVLAIFILSSLIWLILDAPSYLIIVNGIITAFYLLFSIYKFKLIFKAISSNLEVPVTDEEVADFKDAELPIYTILVPVHREAEVLPDILKSLASLDYPAARLDILVLLEEEDVETIQKFDEINPPRFIQKVIVPDGLPKTKPKACNYGLIHARGDYVVIYDAEDLPDRDQLKKVVIAFSKVPENVACIQAKLNYYNRKQNILTEWFTVEYSMWFDLLLPGLDADHAPIPLGGTSNHFKTYALLESGAWDPYNVTEDADLGIRLFKRGFRTRIVDSTTYEEANSQYDNWIRQRSRWLKGYMQTWLVHMRHPLQLIKEIGFKNFMSFQYIVGGTFITALLNPVYWIMTLLWFIAQPEFIQRLFPSVIFFMGAICLYVGTFVFTYINVAGAMRRGYYDMVRTAMISPIYWAMSSIASWKGFIQLIVKPHFWEKTHHGLYRRPEQSANEEGKMDQ